MEKIFYENLKEISGTVGFGRNKTVKLIKKKELPAFESGDANNSAYYAIVDEVQEWCKTYAKESSKKRVSIGNVITKSFIFGPCSNPCYNFSMPRKPPKPCKLIGRGKLTTTCFCIYHVLLSKAKHD